MSSLSEHYAAEEQKLAAELASIRAGIPKKQSGPKGAASEDVVQALLRNFLPDEYGLGSGFIVYRENREIQTSSQIDIIVFDKSRMGPLIEITYLIFRKKVGSPGLN